MTPTIHRGRLAVQRAAAKLHRLAQNPKATPNAISKAAVAASVAAGRYVAASSLERRGVVGRAS